MKTVLFIGCGDIACRYDQNKKNDDNVILTHGGAVKHLKDELRCVACVDPHLEQARILAHDLGCEAFFSNLDDVKEAQIAPDIIAISSPTSAHIDGLEYALSSPAKTIICEKPLTDDLKVSQELAEQFQKAGKRLIINYFRLWDPTLVDLGQRIHGGEFGKLQSAQAAYVKSILHNGPHLINLFRDLLGVIQLHQILDDKGNQNISCMLKATDHGNAPLHIQALNADFYNFFEATLYFEKAVLHLEDGARRIRLRHIAPHPLYHDFIYPEDITTLPNTQGTAMVQLYREALNDHQEPRRTANWAIAGEALSHRIAQASSIKATS